ncbi:MAG: RNA polymerase sporulation sigma factor SigH [Actinomycetota bacterium]|nr:RNA polymerase sporulation sigma factor SigH [Actinomycetota bacterium]
MRYDCGGRDHMQVLWGQDLSELSEFEDLELVRLSRGRDENALVVLLERYRRFARSKARSYFVPGSDQDDVVQEAMIGLYKAVRDFDLAQDTPFRAFAEMCISRQIHTAVKGANRQKHQPLNARVSLDAPVGDSDDRMATALGELLAADVNSDPAELVVSADEIDSVRRVMSETLTDLESDVLHLYMEGKSYDQIAAALGSHLKSIDNALQRVKKKVQNHIGARNADVFAS